MKLRKSWPRWELKSARSCRQTMPRKSELNQFFNEIISMSAWHDSVMLWFNTRNINVEAQVLQCWWQCRSSFFTWNSDWVKIPASNVILLLRNETVNCDSNILMNSIITLPVVFRLFYWSILPSFFYQKLILFYRCCVRSKDFQRCRFFTLQTLSLSLSISMLMISNGLKWLLRNIMRRQINGASTILKVVRLMKYWGFIRSSLLKKSFMLAHCIHLTKERTTERGKKDECENRLKSSAAVDVIIFVGIF